MPHDGPTPANGFVPPDWTPRVAPGTRVLVTGATGGIGRALVAMLQRSENVVIGAHGGSQVFAETESAGRIVPLTRHLEDEHDCAAVVEDFRQAASGIDALVVLSGRIHFSGHWRDMPADDWQADMDVNLNQPFYLARAAMAHMAAQQAGRIVLTGTESALHGGSAMSFPYAIAKRGTECMVQGLAREGAPANVLVNGVRLGYIASGFHQRWHNRTEDEMVERAALVPLKRGGHPDEAAAMIAYLLSGWAGFITGQMLALTGGDWL